MLRRIVACFFLLVIAPPAGWADAVSDCTANGPLDIRLNACTRLIELEPNNATGYENRAFVYMARGDQGRAIADYTKAIEINPNNPDAYNRRGSSYSFKGDNQRAIADFDRVIALNPNYAPGYFNRGSVYENMGDKQRAIADYQMSLKINPGSTSARKALSRLGAAP